MKLRLLKDLVRGFLIVTAVFLLTGCLDSDDDCATLNIDVVNQPAVINGAANSITHLFLKNTGSQFSEPLRNFSATVLNSTQPGLVESYKFIANTCENRQLAPNAQCTFDLQAGSDGVATGKKVQIDISSGTTGGDSATKTFDVGGFILNFTPDTSAEFAHLYYLAIKVQNSRMDPYTIISPGTVQINDPPRNQKPNAINNEIISCNDIEAKGRETCDYVSDCLPGKVLTAMGTPGDSCHLWLKARVDNDSDLVSVETTVLPNVDGNTCAPIPVVYHQWLYAGGEFGPTPAAQKNIANPLTSGIHELEAFDGTNWTRIDKTMSDPDNTNAESATALALYKGDLYVGGGEMISGAVAKFGPAMLQFIPTLKKWNGYETDLTSVGTLRCDYCQPDSIATAVTSLFVNPVDNRLYIGGIFDGFTGLTNVHSMLSLDKEADVDNWSNVGSGLIQGAGFTGNPDPGTVRNINYSPNLNKILVAGNFDRDGTMSVTGLGNVASWTSATTSWAKVANGLSGETLTSIIPFTAFGGSEKLYASFNTVPILHPASPPNQLAVWDENDLSDWDKNTLLEVHCATSSLQKLPTDHSPCREEIYAMTVSNVSLDSNTDDKLCIGGAFNSVGDIADRAKNNVTSPSIACFDGNLWHSVLNGIDYSVSSVGLYSGVYAMVSHHNNLYIGGNFKYTVADKNQNKAGGGIDYNNVIRYDGSAWQQLGTGIDAYYKDDFQISGVRSLLIVPSISAAGQ